ncbi:MAG: tRNA 2-thiocytidine biosynthesis TtcA family protein [Huintestinicola sp.]
MQKMLGYVRKAVNEFDMLSNGDRVAVGVSGGKDSLVLLTCLSRLRKFIGIDYYIAAVTLDPRFGGVEGDFSFISGLCQREDIEYHIIPTQIGEIVFDERQETNPCSLCARMRRRVLYDAAEEIGCNKLALGHHYNDAAETFIMNLFSEGRIGCFSPVSCIEDRGITVIRPLVLAPEKEIRRAANRNGLEAVKSRCPADGHTNRERIKQFLADMDRQDKGFTDRIFGAMRRADVDGWAGREFRDYKTKRK